MFLVTVKYKFYKMSRTTEFVSPNRSKTNKLSQRTTTQVSSVNENFVTENSLKNPFYYHLSEPENIDSNSNIQQENHLKLQKQLLPKCGSLVSSHSYRHTKKNRLKQKKDKKLLVSTSAYNHPTAKDRYLVGASSMPILTQKRYFLRGSTNYPSIECNQNGSNLASGEHVKISENIHKTNNSTYTDETEMKNSSLINVDFLSEQVEIDESQKYDQITPRNLTQRDRDNKNFERSTFTVFQIIHIVASYFASIIWELGKFFIFVIIKPFHLVWWIFFSFLHFAQWCKTIIKLVGLSLLMLICYLLVHFGLLHFQTSINSFQKSFIDKYFPQKTIASKEVFIDEVFKYNLQKLELSLEEVELSFADRHASVLKAINDMQKKYESDQSNALENQNNMLASVEMMLSKAIASQLLRNNEIFQSKLDDIQTELNNLNVNHSQMVSVLHNEIYEKVELSRDIHRPLAAKLKDFEQKIIKLDSTLENLKTDYDVFKTSINKQYGNVTFLREISNEQFIENFLKVLQKGASSNLNKQKIGETRRHKLLAVIFLEWLQKRGFVNEDVLKKIQNQLAKQFSTVQENFKDSLEKTIMDMKKISYQPSLNLDNTLQQPFSTKLTENLIKTWINEALNLYSADRIGIPDYALESAGGAIIESRCTPSIPHKTTLVSLLGIPLYYNINSPRSLIQPGVMPGECWAFQGAKGYAVIGLSSTIRPTFVTIDHIPKSIALFDNISSAPKDFSVYGLKDASDVDGHLLGIFRFEESGNSIQQFRLDDVGESFNHIELRIDSNWGHPDFTCVYRFRVHGQRVIA